MFQPIRFPGIPNLAAQRAGYIESQLKALKDGTRKNPIMNAMAAQLTGDEIANVAAYFASLPGAPTAAKSELLPNVAKTSVTFPEGYDTSFTKYLSMNFPATKQVRYFYANEKAVKAAKAGEPPTPRWRAMRDGARTSPRCSATRTGTTRSSRPRSSRAPG